MGFESGDFSECPSTVGTVSVVTSPVYGFGTYAMRANPTTSAVGNITIGGIAANGTSLTNTASIVDSYVRFRFRYATKPASGSEIFFSIANNAAAAKCSLRLKSDGIITFNNSAGTLVETGSHALVVNTWYEILLLCGTGTAANYAVWIDRVQELGGTASLLVTNAAVIRPGKYLNVGSQTVDFFYDDIYWDDVGSPGTELEFAL